MKQLNSWFEIDEHEYLMYLLQGYKISATQQYVIWILDGDWHREDGPAIIWSGGSREYLLNGMRHRIDGPATIWENGSKSWYLNGKKYTETEFNEEIKRLV